MVISMTYSKCFSLENDIGVCWKEVNLNLATSMFGKKWNLKISTEKETNVIKLFGKLASIQKSILFKDYSVPGKIMPNREIG